MSFKRPYTAPITVNGGTARPQFQEQQVFVPAPAPAPVVRAPLPASAFLPTPAPAFTPLPSFGRQALVGNPFADLMRYLSPPAQQGFTGQPLVAQPQQQAQPDPILQRAQQMMDAGAQMHPDANQVGYGRRRGDTQGNNIAFQYERDNPPPIPGPAAGLTAAPPAQTPGVSPDGTAGPQPQQTTPTMAPGFDGATSDFSNDVGYGVSIDDPALMGQYTFNQQKQRVTNGGAAFVDNTGQVHRPQSNQQKIDANNQARAGLDQQVKDIEKQEDDYMQANAMPAEGGWLADPNIKAMEDQIAQIEAQYSVLKDSDARLSREQAIYAGDTYQGRANPDWGPNLETGLNVLDAGRESVVTQYGDEAYRYSTTGDAGVLVDIINHIGGVYGDPNAPSYANPQLDENGNLTISPNANQSGSLTKTDAQGNPVAPTTGPTSEADAKGPNGALNLIGWLNEDPERKAEYIRVYNEGYDADGDGRIDYIGGRAGWEWYIGQQPWYISATSQIVFDPLNLTIVAGGVAGGFRGAAEGAEIAGQFGKARWLRRAEVLFDVASKADDPLWWTVEGPKKAIGKGLGLANIGRPGFLNQSERAARQTLQHEAEVIANGGAGDLDAMAQYAKTNANSIVVYAPTTINGQSARQVGNTGTYFVGSDGQGGYTVYTKAGNKYTPGQSYATEAGAMAEAKTNEQALVASASYSNSASAKNMAVVTDRAVPTKLVVRNGSNNIAYVGFNGELLVSRDTTGQFIVAVKNGGKYTTTGTYNSLEDAMNAAEANYLGMGQGATTLPGTQVQNTVVQPQLAPAPQQAAVSPQVSPTNGAPPQQGAIGGQQTPVGVTPQQVTPTGAANAAAPAKPSVNLPSNPPPGTTYQNSGTKLQFVQQGNGSGAWVGTTPNGSSVRITADPNGTYSVYVAPASGSAPTLTNGYASADDALNAVTSAGTGANRFPIAPTNGTVHEANGDPYRFVQRPNGQQVWIGNGPDNANISITPQQDGTYTLYIGAKDGRPARTIPGFDSPDAAVASLAPNVGQVSPTNGTPAGTGSIGQPATQQPTQLGLTPTNAAGDVGRNIPQPAATSAEVSPPSSEGAIGTGGPTPVTTEDNATRAANDAGRNVPPAAEQQAAQDAAIKTEREAQQAGMRADQQAGRQAEDLVPASVADESPAARTERIMSDTPESALPVSSTVAEAPPAGAAPNPEGAQGMYRSTITSSTGENVVDYSPPKRWTDAAVQAVVKTTGDEQAAQTVVRDFLSSNPRVQRDMLAFEDALKSGDEIDQSLAAMELQATMAEEWASSGLRQTYGDVPLMVSTGADGATLKAAQFPEAWPQSGRSIERLSTGRWGGYDAQNLERGAILPHKATGGIHPDIESALRGQKQLDRFGPSANGERFFLADGRNRFYQSQLRKGDESAVRTQNELRQLLNDQAIPRATNTRDRLRALLDRNKAIERGTPLDPNAVDQQLADLTGAPAAPTKATRPEPPPGADTQASKARADQMPVDQQKAKPGRPRVQQTDVDFKDLRSRGQQADEFGNLIPHTRVDADIIYNGPRLRDVSGTDRLDLVRVNLGRDKGWMLRNGETGELIGYGSSLPNLKQAIAENRGAAIPIRVFDADGKQVSMFADAPGPKSLYDAITKANDGAISGGTIKLSKDDDGMVHILVQDSKGNNRAVLNQYASEADAKKAVQKAFAQNDKASFNALDINGNPFIAQQKRSGLGITPFGTRRNPTPVVPNPKNDGTLAGALFDAGEIEDRTYKWMTQKFVHNGVDTTFEQRLIDNFLQSKNLDAAYDQTVLDLANGKYGKLPTKTGRGSTVGTIYTTGNQVYRDAILHSLPNAIRGPMNNVIGDMFTQALGGHPLAAINEYVRNILRVGSAGTIYDAVRTGEKADFIANNDLFKMARQNGVSLPSDVTQMMSRMDGTIAGSDLTVSKLLQSKGVPRNVANAASLPFGSRFAADLRLTTELTGRTGIGRAAYDEALQTSRATMARAARDLAVQAGEDPQVWVGRLRAMGTDINEDLIKAAFPSNTDILKVWRQETEKISTHVRDTVRKITFTAPGTKLDEALSQVMFFHYWTTRAIAFHVEAALKNPMLIRLYANAYTNAKEYAESQDLPPWMNTYIHFMGDPEGWMGYANPLGLVVPLFMFADSMGQSGSVGDYVTQFAALSPWIQGALGVSGLLSRAPDITGTTAIRNVIRTTINWAQANGFGPINEKFSPVGDPVDKVIDDFFNWASKIGSKYVPGGQEIEQTDPRDGNIRQINFFIDQQMESVYGPDWRDDPALVKIANDEKAAIQNGDEPGAIGKAAYTQWANDQMKNTGIKTVLPGYPQFLYGPQQEQQKLASAGYDAVARGEKPTEEQQAAMDAISDNSKEAKARDFTEALDGYSNVGTQQQQDVNKLWGDLVYHPEDVLTGDAAYVTISSTEQYSVEEWLAMSTDDRKDAMNRWVQQQGLSEEYDAYQQAKETYRQEHPDVAAYLDWRQAARDGGEEQIHNELMQISPGYASYINGLKDPNDPDGWFTPAAYFASIGQPWKLSDNPEDPLNPSAVNPMQVLTGYQNQPAKSNNNSSTSKKPDTKQTYGTGKWPTETMWKQQAPAEYIEAKQAEHEQAVKDVQPIVNNVLEQGGWGWMGQMSYDELAAQAAKKGTSKQYDSALAAVKQELYRLDVPLPSTNSEVKDYEKWAASQPAGADTSLDAYAAAKTEDRAAYGLQYDSETQPGKTPADARNRAVGDEIARLRREYPPAAYMSYQELKMMAEENLGFTGGGAPQGRAAR